MLRCNRAAARLALGQHAEALADCDVALRLRHDYHKARLLSLSVSCSSRG